MSIFFVVNDTFLALTTDGVISVKSYIKGTQSHGGDGGKRNVTEVPTAQRATEM